MRLLTTAESRDFGEKSSRLAEIKGLESSSKLVSTRLHIAMITRVWRSVLGQAATQDAMGTLILKYQTDLMRLMRPYETFETLWDLWDLMRPYETRWWCLHGMERELGAEQRNVSVSPLGLFMSHCCHETQYMVSRSIIVNRSSCHFNVVIIVAGWHWLHCPVQSCLDSCASVIANA